MNQSSEELGAAVGALIRAAGQFVTVAGAQYKATNPEAWARLVQLFEAGSADIEVTVNAAPGQRILLAAVVNGVRHPVLDVDAEQAGMSRLALN